MGKVIHFFYCPFTGLGLYEGFRGNRWLRNRIEIFKRFVIPSLQNQTSKNFVLWCSWRREEKNNLLVKGLVEYLEQIKEFKTVHTYHGVCFWDDKYPDEEARNRLLISLHDSTAELLDIIGEVDYVLLTIQPSDDCYEKYAVVGIQNFFREHPKFEAVGYTKGYIMNYLTKELAEYNPETNPPFYTIKFPRDIFPDPLKHVEFTSLKKEVGKYKKGTPLPSHEYIGDCLNYASFEERGFLVGTHGENISTYFNHPFKGEIVSQEILKEFGLYNVEPIRFKFNLKKWILRKMPHFIRRKLRYFSEKIYNWLRS